jgi:hypothetical protein
MADESWRIPMLVQELAAKVQEPPSRYLQPEHSLVISSEKPEAIPVIDLSRLLAADGADEEGSKLRLALQSWGLFLVILSALVLVLLACY